MTIGLFKNTVPIVEIDNPKNNELSQMGEDLSDHYPIFFSVQGLKIISYNLQFMPTFIGGAKGKKTTSEIKIMVKQIIRYFVSKGADVCCVQELFDNDANEFLEAGMLKQGYIATSRIGGSFVSFFNGGTRTFIKKQCISHEVGTYEYIYKNKIDYLIGADALVNKGISHSFFSKGTKRIHILNTHLQAYYPYRDHYAEVTLAQCVELKRYIQKQRVKGIIGTHDQLVLCGDFNIPKKNSEAPSNLLYEKMKRIMGPEYIFLNYAQTPGKPIHTLSQKNTYNKGLPRSSDMNITVDMALIFRPITATYRQLMELELADIYSDIQLATSHYIRKNATLTTQWYLSKAQKKEVARFNEKVKALMRHADLLLQQKKNPLDNTHWFNKALDLLSGPGESSDYKPNIKEQDIEPLELVHLARKEMPIKECQELKKRFNRALYHLRRLHGEVHRHYINAPNQYKKIFEQSLRMSHLMLHAWNTFITKPTHASFIRFKNTYEITLNEVIKEFDKEISIWHNLRLIIDEVIHLILSITMYIRSFLINNHEPNDPHPEEREESRNAPVTNIIQNKARNLRVDESVSKLLYLTIK